MSNQDFAEMSPRFRSAADWFTQSVQDSIYTFHIGATSERAVDLMHVLAAHLPERVRVAVTSFRDRKSWQSANCARAEVRDVLARLKVLLAGFGGVEIAIYDKNDQLTLTPELQVIIYSRNADWRDRLLQIGLERVVSFANGVEWSTRVDRQPGVGRAAPGTDRRGI
jgi:hypothetical protein